MIGTMFSAHNNWGYNSITDEEADLAYDEDKDRTEDDGAEVDEEF